MLFAIDPGSKVVGWSAFDNSKLPTLIACGLLRATSLTKMYQEARRAFYDYMGADVVIECPQSYSQRHLQKGPQQDLITIALVGGIVASAANPTSIRSVLPREWKGQVDANVMLQRILKRLTDTERSLIERVKPVSLLHNCIDSAGLGLWAVGRL